RGPAPATPFPTRRSSDLHADLVRAPRLEAQAQQRGAREGAHQGEVRARLARTRAAHGHACAYPRVTPDRSLDRARARGRASLYEDRKSTRLNSSHQIISY